MRGAIVSSWKVLKAARDSKLLLIHTREGYRADLADCPPSKLTRSGKTFTGADGPMGRVLIRGEAGHDITPELYPALGEPIIDKPGKGAFHETDLQLILQNHSIRTLIVCGVSTEASVTTTAREANDRGLLSPRCQNLPTAIRLETSPGWDWCHQSYSRQPITRENNELRGALWRADLSRAPCWRREVPRAHDGHALSAVLAAYPALAGQLSQYCLQQEVRSSLQLLPSGSSTGRVPRLNPGDASVALEGGVWELIGYGSALTPADDDDLFGYLAALWPGQHREPVAAHLKLLRPAIKNQLHGTAGISRHDLSLALQGHYSQSIDHLRTMRISGKPPADVALSAIGVMQSASSSGAECLAGFLHGTRTLEKVAQEEMS